MDKRRMTVLLAILIALLAYFLFQLYGPLVMGPQWHGRPQDPRTLAPLEGRTAIETVVLKQGADGDWEVQVKYYYTGVPSGAQVLIYAPGGVGRDSDEASEADVVAQAALSRGRNELKRTLRRSAETLTSFATKELVVRIRAHGSTVDTKRLAQTIQWPDEQTLALADQLRGKGLDELMEAAELRIDHGASASLREARSILDRVFKQSPSHPGALIESARIAMKSNWGPEGLLQAEQLLSSVLRAEPDNVNAKILLGYVHAHQGRHADAERLFVQADRPDTGNIWLWANWGELKLMQGRSDEALRHYRTATERPKGPATYERARADAYEKLLNLLAAKRDVAALEEAHLRRLNDFNSVSCFAAEYASFLVHWRSNYDKAIEVANPACASGLGRAVTGLAHYGRWAKAKDEGVRADALNQARIHLPSGPRMWLQMAQSDAMLAVARELIKQGSSIEVKDNEGFTALAHALQARDASVVARLMRLGARAETPVGPDEMPAAFIPLYDRNPPLLRQLGRSGVNFEALRHQGMSALALAKQLGDPKVIEALRGPSGSL